MQRELEAKLILLGKLYGKGLLNFSQGQLLSSPLQKQPFKPAKKDQDICSIYKFPFQYKLDFA